MMFRNILHIMMALVLLVSSTGLTISTHYCQGEAVESQINVLPADPGCGMADMEGTCVLPVEHHDNQTHINNIPCCENEFEIIQTVDDFVKEAAQTVFQFDFVAAVVSSALNLDLFKTTTQKLFTSNHSPPIEKDIQVLFQTFLI